MKNASEMKLNLIEWLMDNYKEDVVIGSEVLYSPMTRRADLVMIHNKCSYAFEIKSDCDTIKLLKEQVEDYSKTFDFTFVVTTKTHLHEVERCIPKNIGILVSEEHIFQRRKASQIKRLNKRFLAEFLDKKTLMKYVSNVMKNHSIYDLRNIVSQKLDTKEIRKIAIAHLRKKYEYPSILFEYDLKNSGITIDDLKTLTGCEPSEIR